MMVMMPWNCWQISWNGSVIFKEDVEDWKEREGDHDNNARTKKTLAGKNGTEKKIAYG